MDGKINRFTTVLFTVFLITAFLCGCSMKNDGDGIRVDDLTLTSNALGKDMRLRVYLPTGYNENDRFPVLYFIADGGGSADTVINQYSIADESENLLAAGKIEPTIIVALGSDSAFWFNSSKETKSYETTSGKRFAMGMYSDYLCDDVIPYIDTQYSTIPSKDGRFIGGYSIGGYAALYNAFTHPDLFSKVGGHSPSLFIDDFPDKTVSDWIYPTAELRKERDPIWLAQDCDLAGMSVFLDVEAGGSTGPKYLYDILHERGLAAVFTELSLSHSRSSCAENMSEYLLFYAGVDQD